MSDSDLDFTPSIPNHSSISKLNRWPGRSETDGVKLNPSKDALGRDSKLGGYGITPTVQPRITYLLQPDGSILPMQYGTVVYTDISSGPGEGGTAPILVDTAFSGYYTQDLQDAGLANYIHEADLITTFYTLNDVVRALKKLGFLAGTATEKAFLLENSKYQFPDNEIDVNKNTIPPNDIVINYAVGQPPQFLNVPALDAFFATIYTGQVVNYQLTASGTIPIVFTANASLAAMGLSVSPDGLITGTVVDPGTSLLTIVFTATNSAGVAIVNVPTNVLVVTKPTVTPSFIGFYTFVGYAIPNYVSWTVDGVPAPNVVLTTPSPLPPGITAYFQSPLVVGIQGTPTTVNNNSVGIVVFTATNSAGSTTGFYNNGVYPSGISVLSANSVNDGTTNYPNADTTITGTATTNTVVGVGVLGATFTLISGDYYAPTYPDAENTLLSQMTLVSTNIPGITTPWVPTDPVLSIIKGTSGASIGGGSVGFGFRIKVSTAGSYNAVFNVAGTTGSIQLTLNVIVS